jgi:phage protein D
VGPRTPYYRITVEEVDITPWVSAVTVVEDDQQTDSVTITIQDPRMIYADALLEGSTVEVDMGYAENDEHALMLRAILTKVELSYPESGVPSLTLKADDRSIEMGLEERKAVWRDLTVTGIVKRIAARHGFHQVEAQLAPDPKIVHSKPIHQDGKTDLALLQELAQTYHAKCFVELDGKGAEVLYFIPERRVVTLRRPDQLVLRYRMGPDSNLLSFSPSFDSGYVDRLKAKDDVDDKGRAIQTRDKSPTETVVWSLDPAFTGLANAADRPKIQDLYDRGKEGKRKLQQKLARPKKVAGEVARDQADLEATNDFLEAHRLGMTGGGTTFGNIWLRAKSSVDIQGVNNRFNGRWYVPNVTHKIDGGGYRTEFKCVR